MQSAYTRPALGERSEGSKTEVVKWSVMLKSTWSPHTAGHFDLLKVQSPGPGGHSVSERRPVKREVA